MEYLAPSPEKRFAAMERIAMVGILTGTGLMPILPELCDDDTNLRRIVRWTAYHGAQFVLGARLTLADQQRDFFFSTLAKRFPDLLHCYQGIYPPNSFGPTRSTWRILGLRLKELCEQYGSSNRMLKPIILNHKFVFNKLVVDALANQSYYMELNGDPRQSIWAFRKAAWAVEDLEFDLDLVGLEGLGKHGERRIAAGRGD